MRFNFMRGGMIHYYFIIQASCVIPTDRLLRKREPKVHRWCDICNFDSSEKLKSFKLHPFVVAHVPAAVPAIDVPANVVQTNLNGLMWPTKQKLIPISQFEIENCCVAIRVPSEFGRAFWYLQLATSQVHANRLIQCDDGNSICPNRKLLERKKYESGTF